MLYLNTHAQIFAMNESTLVPDREPAASLYTGMGPSEVTHIAENHTVYDGI